MKSISIKSLVISCLALLILNGCKDKNTFSTQDKAAPTTYHDFVRGYTSGVIQSDKSIEVHFVDLKDLDQVDPSSLISVEPKIEGEATWSGRTLMFHPNENWESGKTYTATIDFSQIKGISTSDDEFRFSFSIIKKSFTLTSVELQNENKQDLNSHTLVGRLKLSDEIDIDKIEKSVVVKSANNKYDVKWEFHTGKNTHTFRASNITRQAKPHDITVSVKGSVMGIEKDLEKSVRIPATGTFQYLDHHVNNGSEQSITINFSDPLDENQEVVGIIQFNPNTKVRTSINGNQIKIYTQQRQVGKFKLSISDHLENIKGQRLDKTTIKNISFVDEKPQVAILKKGVIIPRSEGLKFPFKAVNVRAVRLRIVHILEDNVAFFLQRNKLEGKNEIKRAGRLVYNDVIHLKTESVVDYRSWNNYSFNLEQYINVEPGAIYRVYLSLDQTYSLYPCATETEHTDALLTSTKWNKNINESDKEYWNYYGYTPEVDWRYFNWDDAQNPCKSSYYIAEKATVSQSIVASDLGIIAKMGEEGRVHIAVSDIRSTSGKSGVKVDLYTFQHTLIGSGTTDGEGFATIETEGKPYLLIATDGSDVGYLRLDDGATESVSMFQVEGQKNKEGIKGFIYGERGVWRPGDSIYLSFIMQDLDQNIPTDHPIIFEFYNPKDQLVSRRIKTFDNKAIHEFKTATGNLDPTGNWRAKIKVGNNVFEKSIKVETVKPNRLKMDISFPREILTVKNGSIQGELSAQWLHGAKAANLDADVKLKLKAGNTKFENHDGYNFDDASKNYNTSEKEIFKGELTADGLATISSKVNTKNAPGMLSAQFTTRVYEEGGEFSIDRKVVQLSPFDAYVGLKIPKGSGWRGALKTADSKITKIALLDANGKPMNGKVELKIYGLSWRWWYDSNQGDNLSNFMRSKRSKFIKAEVINVVNGTANFDIPNLNRYGNYLIIVKHSESGHSTSGTYRMYWNSRDNDNQESSKMLQFEVSQEKYQVEDDIEINIPSNGKGHFIVSLENADAVIELKRVKAEKENTKVTFYASPSLIPNAYVYVAYIQEHAQTANDLPIRLYGVQPIFIEDQSTHLTPIIQTSDKWEPEQTVTVDVSEEKGIGMDYTLAIVDEGLLQLTRFKTPNPWQAFHRKEALAVRTWDMYDHIMGAHSGEMAGLLAIGGDGSAIEVGGVKANRFPPMVKFLGPFSLKKGGKKTHEITLPNYVGQVRVMVVSASNRAYGHSEKSIEVKKPLMVLASLPRVVGPGETINLPVTTFAMEDNIKNVNLSIESGKLFSFDKTSSNLNFTQTGDQVTYFPVRVANKIGQEKIVIRAKGHGQEASYSIDIDVRPSNPPVHTSQTIVLEAGEEKVADINLPGLDGTNKLSIEAANGLQFNLGSKGSRLFRYPHGCVEQTTSRAFPQLYLSSMMTLSDQKKAEVDKNIKGGIERLFSFQLRNGGIGYWPNAREASPWGTTYAGHFMLEAEKQGYALPAGYLQNWIKYQKEIANNWLPKNYGVNDHGYRWGHELMQAYRLYTLALADAPLIGAMNRLRGQENLSVQARWRLAMTYDLIGRKDVAKEMISSTTTDIKPYSKYGRTFGSSDRDQAMILEALVEMEDWETGFKVAEKMANKWQAANWYSTQSTSYILMSMFKFLKNQDSKPMDFSYQLDSENENSIQQNDNLYFEELNAPNGQRHQLKLHNKGENRIFVKVSAAGVPLEGNEEASSKNLIMEVEYLNMSGKVVNVSNLERGTDFIAKVTLKNTGALGDYKEMALTQIFPSGWEIHNSRMDALQADESTSPIDYQDIRDDRIYTYFDLPAGATYTYQVQLTATYPGRFYQPSIFCEAMYDKDIYALQPGQWIEIFN